MQRPRPFHDIHSLRYLTFTLRWKYNKFTSQDTVVNCRHSAWSIKSQLFGKVHTGSWWNLLLPNWLIQNNVQTTDTLGLTVDAFTGILSRATDVYMLWNYGSLLVTDKTRKVVLHCRGKLIIQWIYSDYGSDRTVFFYCHKIDCDCTAVAVNPGYLPRILLIYRS